MNLGKRGENFAKTYLQGQGYRIVESNFTTPAGEIDMIARDGETLVFVEVKTRESLRYGHPFESVTIRKRRKMASAALFYLKRFNPLPPCRFDVVSIAETDGDFEVELIRDAFEV